MFRSLAMFAITVSLAAAAASAAPPGNMDLPPQPKTRPAGMPAGFVMVSPCIAHMGEHWVNPSSKTAMNGPIYGTYQGKPVFSEIMVTQKQLQEGFSYTNLQPLPSYKIDHVDMDYEPHGHPGMPFPHYDIHAYYISAAQQMAICPNGIPDPAMKPKM